MWKKEIRAVAFEIDSNIHKQFHENLIKKENSAVAREKNSVVLDLLNGQTVNFILKPPKVIESRTYVKKTQSDTILKQYCFITLTH